MKSFDLNTEKVYLISAPQIGVQRHIGDSDYVVDVLLRLIQHTGRKAAPEVLELGQSLRWRRVTKKRMAAIATESNASFEAKTAVSFYSKK